jgi:hypothetical protein
VLIYCDIKLKTDFRQEQSIKKIFVIRDYSKINLYIINIQIKT